ncbi:MAG: leucyl/phenylalanyl-tRNA--protein transferase [Flavobacteriales bacterium]
MPLFRLHDQRIYFPDPRESPSDVIAFGGDLTPERLVMAYSQGIFPWYNQPGLIRWWSPADRCIILTNGVRVSHSMRNFFNKTPVTFTMDQAFHEVILGCREGEREGETWILDEIVEAYNAMHALGLAHSVEVWENGALVGGLYGISLGHVFFGESMFSRRSNASKAALVALSHHLNRNDWKLIDCQVHNEHLESLGAVAVERNDFLDFLQEELSFPTTRGNWNEAFQQSMMDFPYPGNRNNSR